jgi:protein-tyrosine phosphatase
LIDIHCHILPGLDDGARDMEEAVAMCRLAQADGIQTIVATPHSQNGVYMNSEQTILPVLGELEEHLKIAGVALHLRPGADIHIHPETVSFLRNNPRLLLGGCYFLLELPAQSIPPFTRDFIFEALLAGFIPILTHPERNTILQNHFKDFEEWTRAGVLLQITAMSLTGAFGSLVKECAFKMVRMGMVHLVATDAHSPIRRPPVLSKAREVLETIVGPEQARAMVKDIPEKILKGEAVETIPRGAVGVAKKYSFVRRLKGIFNKKSSSSKN